MTTSLEGWKQALATLGRQLVDLEGDPTVELARTDCLSGGTGAAWDTADAGVAHAWTTYQAVKELLVTAEEEPDRAPALLTAATVPGPNGPTDATTAMVAAKAAVENAIAVAARLSLAWGSLAARADAARLAAAAAGDTSTTRAAAALADLIARDPFAVHDADVAAVEELAARATHRHEAVRTSAARVDLDLARARTALDVLHAEVRAARGELEHAAARIAGVQPADPVRDIDALVAWLDRIAATTAGDPTLAARELDDWQSAAEVRRTELDRALAPAREGMRRREEGRGLWTALRAKAAARRVDERTDVAAALAAAHDLLWQAPCDLSAAEVALARLAAVLESDPTPGSSP